MTEETGVFARPLVLERERWTLLLDRICSHRPWFEDRYWHDPKVRRQRAVAVLADALQYGFVWEVWRGAELTGVIFVNRLALDRDAYAHFVFFDRSLSDKQRLCINGLAWCFERLNLEVVRFEVPTYVRVLANWAHKKLGFRYEMEARQPSWPQTAKPLNERLAMLGSRRHRAVFYEGKWHDMLLLSLTREEFQAHHGSTRYRGRERADDSASRRPDSSNTGPNATDRANVGRVSSEPTGDRQSVPTDIAAQPTDG